MPSAAKRRKAAKKKKEKEANSDLAINDSLGNEDVKSQDEKGSDGGELISPSSRDHHSDQTPFNGAEKICQLPVLQSAVEEGYTNAISAGETDDLPEKIVTVDPIDPAKEGNGGSSSSSSSSSSEDESANLVSKTNTCDNSMQMSDIAPVDEKTNGSAETEAMGNSAAEKTIYVAENEGVESFLSTPNDATETSAASAELTIEKVGEKGPENLPSSRTQHNETPEDSESQPLVAAPAPTMARRTSIFSCCGLFDALTGSNR